MTSSTRGSRRPAYPLAASLRGTYLSQRASLMCRLGIHSTKRYGPVPTYWVTGPAGVASAISFGMIAAAEDGSARKASRGANGSFRFMTTVYLSGAVTASTWLNTTVPWEAHLPHP